MAKQDKLVKDDFQKFIDELDMRYMKHKLELRGPTLDSNSTECKLRTNCALIDYELTRLKRFNHPCAVCGWPLHLTNNFRIADLDGGAGDVCVVCHTMYTIVAASMYFVDLHRREKDRGKKK